VTLLTYHQTLSLMAVTLIRNFAVRWQGGGGWVGGVLLLCLFVSCRCAVCVLYSTTTATTPQSTTNQTHPQHTYTKKSDLLLRRPLGCLLLLLPRQAARL
jgi:hypothetical protein